MSCFSHCLFITYWLIITIKASDWDYTNPHEWCNDYPYCGGDTQSPIDIDYNTVDTDNCPVTLENGHEALLWSIVDLKRTYLIENNGHALEMQPHDLFFREESDVVQHPVAVLRNNFVTDSGEHANFCLHTVHIHYGAHSDLGSEHEVNGKRSPMEMHFVHYSCDYDSFDEAMADKNVKDKFVLAVVSILFEVGEHNEYFDHITHQIDYIMKPGDQMLITNADLSDLIPLTTTDFIYYEGSLTTPGCDPVVRWHILGKRWSISEEQLEILRQLEGDDHEDVDYLENNFRPIQDNKNPVYYCTAEKDRKLPGTYEEIEQRVTDFKFNKNSGVEKDNSQYFSSMDILMIAFVIAFVCLVIGLFIGNKYMSDPFERKTFVMSDL